VGGFGSQRHSKDAGGVASQWLKMLDVVPGASMWQPEGAFRHLPPLLAGSPYMGAHKVSERRADISTHGTMLKRLWSQPRLP
jgi:hypothetical protein